MRSGRSLTDGSHSLRSTASQISLGFCVVSSWNRSAESRHATACGTRTAAAARHLVLAEERSRAGIQPAAESLEFAARDQAAQDLTRYLNSVEVTRAG